MPDRSIPRKSGCLLALAVLLQGAGMSTRAASAPADRDTAGRASIQVRSDRLTLRVAKAPQVYLSGPIGPDALRQVDGMLRSGRIPRGSDVYLDSSAGDVPSGLALGRLFRSAGLNTHVGLWRKPTRSVVPARPAVCLDACAYAYLGGVYRWAPSGSDRIGLHASLLPGPQGASGPAQPASPAALRDYLVEMDVRPDYFAHVLGPAENGVVWWKPEEMAPWLVANNGRQPLAASYQPGPAPQLTLSQTVRGGRNRIALRCAPGGVTLTAYYTVGYEHARQLASQARAAYFEVERQPWQPQPGERPHAEGDALVFARPLPFAELNRVLRTVSLGAWVETAAGRVRYGFLVAPAAAWEGTRAFYADCRALQGRR